LTVDLPALDADGPSARQSVAGHHDTSCLADELGTGATLLATPSSACLPPAFASRGRPAHVAAGAIDLAYLDGPSDGDVDTTADLRRALALCSGRAGAASAAASLVMRHMS
jgi:2-phospho-L-lactate guanylyltransferase (CobY/MobA/RfbA family)